MMALVNTLQISLPKTTDCFSERTSPHPPLTAGPLAIVAASCLGIPPFFDTLLCTSGFPSPMHHSMFCHPVTCTLACTLVCLHAAYLLTSHVTLALAFVRPVS